MSHRTDNHRLRGIGKILEHLLSEAKAEHQSFRDISALRQAYPQLRATRTGRCGAIRTGRKMCLWLEENNRIETISLERKVVPFSKLEIKIFDSFEKAMDGLFTDSELRVAQNANRIATKHALGNLLVAHHVRGTASTNFWTLTLIFDELQELALQQYEGKPCSSGFIFISQPSEQIEQIRRSGFQLDEFGDNVHLNEGFFDGTISHRYVDGRNSFYVVDNQRKIYGIARIEEPSRYNIYDRSALRHLDEIVACENGRMMVAFVGRNSDVVVRTKGKALFRWNKLYWKALDLDVLNNIINDETGFPDEDVNALVQTILTCADLRFGSLVLVVKTDQKSLPMAGKIDSSRLSEEVVGINAGKRISEIMNAGTALGILSSDGITTLSQGGKLISSGDIIDLRDTPAAGAEGGGGRTQAALAASKYGLAIKVSADGPITIFRDGKKVIRFEA